MLTDDTSSDIVVSNLNSVLLWFSVLEKHLNPADMDMMTADP